MGRRAATALWVLATLLFLASAGLWVRTYFVKDDALWIARSGSRIALVAKTYPGTLDPATLEESVPIGDAPGWETSRVSDEDIFLSRSWEQEHSVLGFAYIRTSFAGGGNAFHKVRYVGRWRELFVPVWSICALFSLLPAGSVFFALRRRRAGATGLCVQCGYDLRATPERCPECGARANAAATH